MKIIYLTNPSIGRVDAKTLKGAIREVVDRTSRIMTDEWPSYTGIGKEYDGGHSVIRHLDKKFSAGDTYTNTAESFFALLKRGIHGIFHHVAKEHLLRYCEEFSFRWSYRKSSDAERTAMVIRNAFGKRLLFSAAAGGR